MDEIIIKLLWENHRNTRLKYRKKINQNILYCLSNHYWIPFKMNTSWRLQYLLLRVFKNSR